MKIYFRYSSKIPKMLSWFINIYGITFYPFIIFREPEKKVGKVIIRHELIHIHQQKELYILPFYILYLYYWMKNLIVFRDTRIAYMMIPFEREAYEYQKFEDYLKNREKHHWRHYRKLPRREKNT